MPIVPITQPDDPRLAIYRDLKVTNLTRNSGKFVVEGEKLLDRLLGSAFALDSVLAADRFAPLLSERVPSGTPIYTLPEPEISRVVGFNFHRGVLACGVRGPMFKLGDVARSLGRRATVVVCPRIDNPENLGAIVRIGDVFGVDAVVTGGRCPDLLSRRVLRVSMGSVLRVPVIVAENLEGEIERMRNEYGFETAATVVDPAAESIDTFRRPDRLAVFLGNEGNGLEPEWLALCDRRVTIPMRPGAESLNVAVAAGIALYHLARP